MRRLPNCTKIAPLLWQQAPCRRQWRAMVRWSSSSSTASSSASFIARSSPANSSSTTDPAISPSPSSSPSSLTEQPPTHRAVVTEGDFVHVSPAAKSRFSDSPSTVVEPPQLVKTNYVEYFADIDPKTGLLTHQAPEHVDTYRDGLLVPPSSHAKSSSPTLPKPIPSSSSASSSSSSSGSSSSPISPVHKPQTATSVIKSEGVNFASSSLLSVDVQVASTNAPLTSISAMRKSALTPLAHELLEQIKVRGPLSISDYMYQVMQHPTYGYYTTKRDVIATSLANLQPTPAASPTNASTLDSANAAAPLPTSVSSPSLQSDASNASSASTVPASSLTGDFITSPEISQIFGELIGVWLVDSWQKLGSPAVVHLVEMGPGTGKLMSDILRVIAKFPTLYSSMSLHLIETSPVMREAQQSALHVRLLSEREAQDDIFAASSSKLAASQPYSTGKTVVGYTRDRVRVTWHNSLVSVPRNAPLLVVAHEFFDALPVYHFVYRQQHQCWCEVMVDSDIKEDKTNVADAAVAATSSSPLSNTSAEDVIADKTSSASDAQAVGEQYFRFVVTPGPSAASRAFVSKRPGKEGDQIELQAAALSTTEELALRIGQQKGAALIIDYGFGGDQQEPSNSAADSFDSASPSASSASLTALSTRLGFTLQAVQRHRFVHPLHEPGLCDLSTLVNFPALEHTVDRTAQLKRVPVIALPIITQSRFLRNLHVGKRLEALIEMVPESETQDQEVEALIEAARRLVEEEQMGGLFKAMAIVHESIALDVSAWWQDEAIEKKLAKQRQQRLLDTTQAQASAFISSSNKVRSSSKVGPIASMQPQKKVT